MRQITLNVSFLCHCALLFAMFLILIVILSCCLIRLMIICLWCCCNNDSGRYTCWCWLLTILLLRISPKGNVLWLCVQNSIYMCFMLHIQTNLTKRKLDFSRVKAKQMRYAQNTHTHSQHRINIYINERKLQLRKHLWAMSNTVTMLELWERCQNLSKKKVNLQLSWINLAFIQHQKSLARSSLCLFCPFYFEIDW